MKPETRKIEMHFKKWVRAIDATLRIKLNFTLM